MTLPCILCPDEKDGCRKSCYLLDQYSDSYRKIEELNLRALRAKKEEEHRQLVERMRVL